MVTNYNDIAAAVLKLAAQLDARMKPDGQDDHAARKAAWVMVIEGRVWPTEAEAAVIAHYRNPRAFPIMPGDVIAYCEAQPVWSSIDHARDWIMHSAVQMPYSGAIEAYSGVQEPIIEIPPQIARENHKAYLTEQLTNWAQPRLDELATAIVTKRFQPWWSK